MFSQSQERDAFGVEGARSAGPPSLTARMGETKQKDATEKSGMDALPSVPQVLQLDREHEKSAKTAKSLVPFLSTTHAKEFGEEYSSPNFIRTSMYVVPADEDLFDLLGLPLLVVVQPFNYVSPVPETSVPQVSKCKGCLSFPTLSEDAYAYKCVICGVQNEVHGECLSLREPTVDYILEESAARDRFWYSGDALPKIEGLALSSCRKWSEPCVVFAVDSSHLSKGTAGYREFLSGMKDILKSYDFSFLYKRFGVVLMGKTPAVVADSDLGYAVHIMHGAEGASGMCSPLFIETDSLTDSRIDSLIMLVEEYASDKTELKESILTAIQLVSYTGGGKLVAWLGSSEQSLKNSEKVVQSAVDCGVSVHGFMPSTSSVHGHAPAPAAPSVPQAETLYSLFYGTGGSLEREEIKSMLWDRVIKPTQFRCTVRVVGSNGLKKRAVYSGGFSENISTVTFPEMDASTTFCVSFSVEDFLKEATPLYIQVSVEYIDMAGRKRVRVINHKLKASRLVQQVFASLSFETLFCGMCKYICAEPANMVENVRKAENAMATALALYKKVCAKESASNQLVLPEPLKLLPVLLQSVLKYPKIHLGLLSRIEVAGEVMPFSVERTLRMFYPRLVRISSLFAVSGIECLVGERLTMSMLSTSDGYLLDTGSRAILWFGKEAADFREEMIESKVVRNALEKLKEIYGVHIKTTHCVQGHQDAEFIGYMVEDQMGGYPKYQDYLGQLHAKVTRK
ncbi:protein transport protein SEC24 [Nematocida sp. AWRm77]|nr:protein transport protein SEC24 [Nematocida sp. AWRm77]